MAQKITIVGYNNDYDNPLITLDEIESSMLDLDLSDVHITIEEI